MIKASADGDSEAQRERSSSHKSLLRRGPITGSLFPAPCREGPCRRGEAGLWQRQSAELLRIPGAKLFVSAERGAVRVLTGEREIQVIVFLSLASSAYEIAQSSIFLGVFSFW